MVRVYSGTLLPGVRAVLPMALARSVVWPTWVYGVLAVLPAPSAPGVKHLAPRHDAHARGGHHEQLHDLGGSRRHDRGEQSGDRPCC